MNSISPGWVRRSELSCMPQDSLLRTWRRHPFFNVSINSTASCRMIPPASSSRLSQSSGQGRAVRVSHDLWVVLQQALSVAERTRGAFDVVKPSTSTGYKQVQLDAAGRTVTLLAPGMRLDLRDFAKGYAVDQALHVLGRFGIGNALVSDGGDWAASGPPPGERGWRIELPSLDETKPSRVVLLSYSGLSTSGGLTRQSLVTVIAPDDFSANNLSKVMSAPTPKAALKLVKHTPRISARIVRESGGKIEVYESRRFQRFYP